MSTRKENKTVFKFFQDLELNTQMYHWLTESYSRHMGSDKLYKNILETTDKFIEVYIGRYGRPKFSQDTITIKKMTDEEFVLYLKKSVEFLENKIIIFFKPKDTDLLNIRDELIAQINQALYLFTLN
jgi:hypothetical protein